MLFCLLRSRLTVGFDSVLLLGLLSLSAEYSETLPIPTPGSFNRDICQNLFDLQCWIDFEKCDTLLKLGGAIRDTISHLNQNAKVHTKLAKQAVNRTRVASSEMLQTYKNVLPAVKSTPVGNDRPKLQKNYESILRNLSSTIAAMNLRSNDTTHHHLFVQEFLAHIKQLHEVFETFNTTSCATVD